MRRSGLEHVIPGQGEDVTRLGLPPHRPPGSGVGSPPTAEPPLNSIAVASLKARIASGAPLTLLDVRSPEEFELEHIPGAINIPVDTLTGALDRVPRGRPVVTVCAKGHGRSRGAAATLSAAGLPDVAFLEGGLAAWRTG